MVSLIRPASNFEPAVAVGVAHEPLEFVVSHYARVRGFAVRLHENLESWFRDICGGRCVAAVLGREFARGGLFSAASRTRAAGVAVPLLGIATDEEYATPSFLETSGLSDIVRWPLDPGELMVRMSALLRNRWGPLWTAFTVGRLTVDLVRREARVDGHVVELSRLESRAFFYLVESAPAVVSLGELQSQVNRAGGDGTSSQRLVSRLGNKLKPGCPYVVRTVRGEGCFVDLRGMKPV
jgi:DNA-binding response OmpR family regulator